MRDLVKSTLLSLNWHFERDDLLSQQYKLDNCLATYSQAGASEVKKVHPFRANRWMDCGLTLGRN